LDLATQSARRPAKVSLEDLANVHAAWNAERIEDDIDLGPVFEERHVLDRQDAADHALVTVTASHLVARLKLALHRDEHLDHLEHARREFIAGLELADTILVTADDHVDSLVILGLQRFDVCLTLVVLDRDL